ncbi:hypothetical protein [Variovorax sp. LT1R16]|uniref:hypothetical protein n=1 Tax=Variovorax sp. LT1R16 TaxID=3443728 RepID=UPI003F48B282
MLEQDQVLAIFALSITDFSQARMLRPTRRRIGMGSTPPGRYASAGALDPVGDVAKVR